MDPTVDAMLLVYAAALRRHQQHFYAHAGASLAPPVALYPCAVEAGTSKRALVRTPRGRR